jgi:hypothetical protein
MYKNSTLKRGAEKLALKTQRRFGRGKGRNGQVETTYSVRNGIQESNGKTEVAEEGGPPTNDELIPEQEPEEGMQIKICSEEESNLYSVEMSWGSCSSPSSTFVFVESGGLCSPPYGEGCQSWVEWVICWPCRLVFSVTVPDCSSPRWMKWYPLTFAMCIVWIGTLSYVVNWMMTIIGEYNYIRSRQ